MLPEALVSKLLSRPICGNFWCDARVTSLERFGISMKLLLFIILLLVYWPAALLALVLYPIAWLLSLPFRVVGIAVDGVFDLLRAVLTLPARVLRAI